jgi:hypothetical protein
MNHLGPTALVRVPRASSGPIRSTAVDRELILTAEQIESVLALHVSGLRPTAATHAEVARIVGY